MEKLILIEKVPNYNVQRFHTNRVISHTVIEHFMRPLRKSSESYLKKVGLPGASVVRATMALPGVTEIFIKPYELSVTISEVHNWDSLEPSVIRILCKEVFGTNQENVLIARK